MSRIAKNPVFVPAGVDVKIEAEVLLVKGKNGQLTLPLHRKVAVVFSDSQLLIVPNDDSREANSLSGTIRALVANMVKGVADGFERRLQLIGVGYRAQAQGNILNLSLGFSHPVVYQMPSGVTVQTPSQTEIVLFGADKQAVGQVASEIRAFRSPEPYKGKGVRYAGEVVVMKEAKKK
ncbi:ribosomal protein L6 [Neisseria sp. oral taxon 020 str. F0370]|uniref:50S ribosomal protein L6 n=1 Tax=unclassified Neisseria TaxID=2623750 RepID=UPI0002A45057|nr:MULTISPECIES: 50S ribosomal protein L6 [unclassified Neisseria]ASP17941.1 50S ribosomal protein L6 [Neisseria sp. KEM232]EKY05832.1 ribosomal protein L6 [Neisseria sp. oral taxon 020 str. F0370]